MPVKKHDNKKNAPMEKRDSAVVPTKENALKPKVKMEAHHARTMDKRVNALSTAGKKKRPK